MPQLMRLATMLLNSPLLVEHHYAAVVASVLAPRLGVQPLLAANETMIARPARMPMMYESGILVLPIVGGLMHRGDGFDAMSGAESYTHVNNMLMRAIHDPDVRAILLDIDSPGGQVGGCFELCDTIFDARKEKPIWAIANTVMCSAAYAIGSSAIKCYATQTAQVGSIGVCWLHADMSGALKEAGIVTTWVFAGAHKVDGNSLQPLPKDVKADFQASINESYELFVEAVAKRRPMTADAVRKTEARVYGAKEAADLKLVDGVQSLQATVVALQGELGAKTSTVVQLNSEDEPIMTTPAAQPAANQPAAQPAAQTVSLTDHNAAVAAAREEGRKAGRAEAGKILSLPSATNRQNLAAVLAADASIAPEGADKILAAAPEAKAGGQLSEAMKAHNPKVGEGGEASDDKAARIAQLQSLGKQANAVRR